jgi:hypothetical protein
MLPLLTSYLSLLTKKFLGGYAEGVTPVPIPNTEVKPLRADGTARAAVWESRSPPGFNRKARQFLYCAGFFASKYVVHDEFHSSFCVN